LKLPPNSVLICGEWYKIEYNKKESGGEFNTADHTIKIGTKYPKCVFETLCHEIAETVMTELKFRYTYYTDGNDKMLFSFDHSEFESILKAIIGAFRTLRRI